LCLTTLPAAARAALYVGLALGRLVLSESTIALPIAALQL
jgi:hypothetical protein